MNDIQPIPTSLKIVAVLFIIGGISSLIEIIVSLLHGQLSLDFGVLGLFIGVGLRRLSPTWRTWALVFTWITLLVTPVGVLLFINSSGPLDFTLFGIKMGHVPKAAGVVGAVVFFLISVWQYRVLTRPDVRALFGLPPAG
jgi:hypothetical protein